MNGPIGPSWAVLDAIFDRLLGQTLLPSWQYWGRVFLIIMFSVITAVEALKNGFINLAVPFITMSEVSCFNDFFGDFQHKKHA